MSRLEELLEYVSEHNDFYKDIIKKCGIKNPIDINQYPILTRRILQTNRYNMFSEGYKMQYYDLQLRRKASSGSSGIPVNVYWDNTSYFSAIREIWTKRSQYYGINVLDKQLSFALNGFNTSGNSNNVSYINSPKNILNINFSTVHKNNDYLHMIDLISEFQPDWIYIRPFVLQKLMELYDRFNIPAPSSVKYIESHGEILTIELQQQAMDFFKVPVANMYGSEEINTIAYECPYHNMHVLNNSVFVECQNENGVFTNGKGEAIVTSLANKAMPLIRYNQGDEIILSQLTEPCLCGSHSPIIKKIIGRVIDIIKIDDGYELNATLFLEIMAEVNNHYGGIITGYKYIYQKSTKVIQCHIEIDYKRRQWYTIVKKTIDEVFRRRVPLSLGIKLIVVENNNISDFNKKNRIFEIVL